MIFVISYFVLFSVNSLVLFFANQYFPQQVVLGTFCISKCWGIIHSMSTLALINTFAIPFIQQFEKRRKRMLTNTEWLVTYFFINFVGVWLIARFADQLGFGVKSWVAAAALAIVLDITQGIAMMTLEKLRKK